MVISKIPNNIKTLEQIVQFLIEQRRLGKTIYVRVYGHILDSDIVTMESAIEDVFGFNKEDALKKVKEWECNRENVTKIPKVEKNRSNCLYNAANYLMDCHIRREFVSLIINDKEVRYEPSIRESIYRRMYGYTFEESTATLSSVINKFVDNDDNILSIIEEETYIYKLRNNFDKEKSEKETRDNIDEAISMLWTLFNQELISTKEFDYMFELIPKLSKISKYNARDVKISLEYFRFLRINSLDKAEQFLKKITNLNELESIRAIIGNILPNNNKIKIISKYI